MKIRYADFVFMKPSIDMKNQQYTNIALWPCYFHLAWRYAKVCLASIIPLAICLSLIIAFSSQLSHANTTSQQSSIVYTRNKSVMPIPSSFSELQSGKWQLSYIPKQPQNAEFSGN